MKIISPIWYEGTLLLPQIFQQQETEQQAHLLSLSQLSRITNFGVGRLVIDQESLSLRKLKLIDCSVYFQDGTWFDAKKMQYLPPSKDLTQVPSNIHQTIVYLSIPEINVVGTNLLENTNNSPLRFIKKFTEVPDLFGSESAEIAEKTLNFTLKLDYENRQNYLTIPITKLIRDQSNEWRIDVKYIPPILFVSSNDHLVDMLAKQIHILQNKSYRLALLRKERSQQSADFLVSDVSLFWLLNILNQSIPEMKLIHDHKYIPPENYYIVLSRLVGSLLSFSFDFSIQDIPAYNPNNLGETFSNLNKKLLFLLDTVIPTVLVIVDLEHIGQTRWIGHLSDSRLDETADYYLSIRANTPLYELQEKFPKLCKIGSPDDVERIIPSASNGIPLHMMQRLPSALPMRSEATYFALDKSSISFKNMIAARSCCIYSPNSFDGLNIEMYVVPNE